MKINLKKPISWFGSYDFAKLLTKNEDRQDKIANSIPETPFNKLHKFRQWLNRDKIRIDKWDTWSMDYTLAPIIIPLLKQLKESKHGIPIDFVHQLDKQFWSGVEQEQLELFPETIDVYENESVRQWNMCLDHMIWSFEQLVRDGEGDAYWEPYWVDMKPEEIADEMKNSTIPEMFGGEKVYKKIHNEMYELYNNQVQEGFELFGKHFRSLWD